MHFAPYQYQPAALQAVRCDYVTIAQWVMQQLPKHYQYEHFGSTAIGVHGKAVIDIACLYPNVAGDSSAKQTLVDQTVPKLLAMGCEWQWGKTLFSTFRPRLDIAVSTAQGEIINVHIHVIEYHSKEHLQQRYFRQRLLNSPALRQEYMQYKKHILDQGITEHQAYGKAKSAFVKRILAEMS